MSGESSVVWRAGSCHCGAVRFEALLPGRVEAQACNCSICARTGFTHLIVPESGLRILQGREGMTEYAFNTGVARHLFCRICGVKPFYRPRSNPDGWSVNARCLDHPEALDIVVADFDGRDWERHAGALAHLSKEARA